MFECPLAFYRQDSSLDFFDSKSSQVSLCHLGSNFIKLQSSVS